MPRSTRSFDRWINHDPTTWSFQVFQRYNFELTSIWDAHILASRKTYSELGKSGAQWSDLPSKHFQMKGVDWTKYTDLKTWSDSYNLFDNWVNLSATLTVASNLETYLASVIAMALESDPGIVMGGTKLVDGAVVLKTGKPGGLRVADYVEPCIHGVWSARLAAFEKLFGEIPVKFTNAHADLEELRKIRNRFGHAFGREIDEARLHGTLSNLPMEVLGRSKAQNFREKVLEVVKSVDAFLLQKHIGDFEAVRFYHNLYPKLHKHVPKGQRARDLKTAIGRFGAIPRGKVYCNGLVDYWEAL